MHLRKGGCVGCSYALTSLAEPLMSLPPAAAVAALQGSLDLISMTTD